MGHLDPLDGTRSPVRNNSPTTSEAHKAALITGARDKRNITKQRRAITQRWDDYMTGKTKEHPTNPIGDEAENTKLRSKPPRARENPRKKRRQATPSVNKELLDICHIRAVRFNRKYREYDQGKRQLRPDYESSCRTTTDEEEEEEEEDWTVGVDPIESTKGGNQTRRTLTQRGDLWEH